MSTTTDPDSEPLRVPLSDGLGACCGRCTHWNRAKKRNCSNPDTPVYYAECLYPVDETRIPHCVTFEETYERNGTNCPCFAAVDEAPNAELNGGCKPSA